MTDPVDAIIDRLRERGASFGREDWREVNELSLSVPVADLPDVWRIISETLWLTVADPLYQGDLTLAEIGF